MFQPYPYQVDCLKAITKARRQKKSKALVVMAPGLGKTVTAVLDIQRWLRSRKNQRVLYLCHQTDILEQAHQTCISVMGESKKYAYFTGRDKNGAHEADVVFASFQTMRRKREVFAKKEFGYVLVDESHHSHAKTYLPTLQYFQPEFLLGITATPDRCDLQDIRLVYGQEVFDLPLEQALAQNLLTDVDYRIMTDEFSKLSEVNTPIGRLSVKELNRRFFVPKRDEELARVIKRHIANVKNPRVMIFCRSAHHCNECAKHFDNATAIHYQIKEKEQQRRLDDFRSGKTNVVLTVDKFNEGIDIPEANIIVFLRSTSSPTVFLQQLGRGLRKMEGKDKVLVLDFVSNVERLESVYELFVEALVREGEVDPRQPSLQGRSPVSVNVGSVNFNEKPVSALLAKIREIREGYTEASLIRYLRELSRELGRPPMGIDVEERCRQGLGPSQSTIVSRFGSWPNSLRAAGLTCDWVKTYTKERLITDLQNLAKELGRNPKVTDPDKRKEMASSKTYMERFGSWNGALLAAGLPCNNRMYSDEELIEKLQQVAKELGRAPYVPEIDEMSKRGESPSASVFSNRFGTWKKAIKKAGLKEPPLRQLERRHDEEEMLEHLRKFYEREGRAPCRQDFKNKELRGDAPNAVSYVKYFGSWDKALKAAGLEKPVDVRVGDKLNKEEMLGYLRDFYRKEGRSPNSRDFRGKGRPKGAPGSSSYVKYFGSWDEALEAAGLPSKK